MNKRDTLLKKALLEDNTSPDHPATPASIDSPDAKDLQALLRSSPEARRKYARMRSLLRTARAAQASDRPEPPEGLTARVMARIAAKSVPAAKASAKATDGPPSLQALSAQGLAYVFIAFALFYCIIGVFMHLALNNAPAAALPGWILRQPRIALLSALVFGFCGVLLLRRGRRVAKLLYLALTGYMLCLAANALQVQLTANVTAQTLGLTLGLAAYVGGGLVICLFLGDLLRRLPKNGWHKANGA